MHKSFFLLLISVYVGSLSAQNYSIKNYSVESGLPTQNVFCAAQDKTGKMWFATRVGVSVYDGLNWVNYDSRHNLPKISYSKIKIDTSGTAWVAPRYLENPICYFKDGKWFPIPAVNIPGAASLMMNSFEIIYKNGKPIQCVGTAFGLFYYKDNTWHSLTAANGLPDDKIFFLSAHRNKLYIATQKGLAVFDGESIDNSLQKIIPSSKHQLVAVTCQTERNGTDVIWLLGKKWIGNISNSKFNLLYSGINLNPVSYNDNILFSASGHGRVYFGNSFAKYFVNINTKRISPLLQRNGFASNTAMSVFVDREENVWFSDTRGVDKMNNFLFNNYFEFSGLQSNEVTAVIESTPGNYVFGHNNGITILDNQNFRRINFLMVDQNMFLHQRILDFSKDVSGNIFFAASGLGIGKIDKTGSLTWLKSPKGEKMTSVFCQSDGVIWACSDYMLYRIDGNTFIPAIKGKFPFPGFRKIFSFNNGVLYLTSINGIYCYKNRSIQNLLKSDTKAPSMIRNVFTMLKIGHDEFLIGTEDGLYSLFNGKTSKIEKENFPNNIPVFAIKADKSNNIFIGTNDGFYKFEKSGRVKYFTMTNGLSGREINRSAFMFDSFNNLWIGTDRGLSCFMEENENYTIPVPEIELKSIELIDGARLSLDSDISLKNNQNTFFVNFCGISFVDEGSIEYKVLLEGFDKKWLTVSQSQIKNLRYTNLPYGIYRFQVLAKNRLGNWSKPVYSGIITVQKPYYYKWWFILSAAVFELFLLLGIRKLILLRAKNTNLKKLVDQKTAKLQESENHLRQANEELEKRVEERTLELANANEKLRLYAEEQKQLNTYKDKFFSIVAHDLKSPFQGLLGLTSILEEEFDNLTAPQVKHFLKALHNSTQNVYNLISNLLQWSRLQTGKMPYKPEVVSLYDHAVSVQNVLHPNYTGKNIKFSIDVPENMELFADKHMLNSLLQNIGSNAIKFTPAGGCVTIKAAENDKFARISIIDTGVGIAPENLEKLFRIDLQFSTPGTNDEEGTGLGLSICKEMVEKHNGSIWVESEEGKGSSFIFTIPLAGKN